MVDERFVDLLDELEGQGRTIKATYGRLRGAEMELHDENEKALLEADPVTVLVEFGHVVGVKLMDLFVGMLKNKFFFKQGIIQPAFLILRDHYFVYELSVLYAEAGI